MSTPSPRRDVTLDRRLAYALFRFTLGLNLLLHGLVRIGDLGGFAQGLVQGFADTVLPAALVRLFAYALVPAEAVIGALLILGLFTRAALVAGALVMAALVFGTALRQEWTTLGLQMNYALFYALLLFLSEYNGFSVDRLLSRRRATDRERGRG